MQNTNEKYFEVTVFERHSEVAGIWNLTTWADKFQTPMYQGLETNVPRNIMEYKDFPYPRNTSLFPNHNTIRQYIESYSSDIRHVIELNSEVTMVTKINSDNNLDWKVEATITSRRSIKKVELFFNAVVVATGTFNKFCMPPNLAWDDWKKGHPGSVIHAGEFMRGELKNGYQNFEGKVSRFLYFHDFLPCPTCVLASKI